MLAETHVSLLEPFEMGDIRLRNRLAVAPMTRVSAGSNGVPSERMAEYYAEFARGEFGLIITEGVYPDALYSRALERQPGLATAAQVDGWRRVTRAVHAHGGLILAQLMHAGALSQSLAQTIAPSSVRPKGEKLPEYGGSGLFPIPRAMDQEDIRAAVTGFVEAAARARDAGFDGVELHGANGYLIDQFLTDYTNIRTDEYGQNVVGRVRFAAEVVSAVRDAVGTKLPVGIRLSQTKVNDFVYRWPGGEADAEIIFRAVRDAGASYIHVASEGRDWRDTARFRDHGPTITQIARQVTGLPVIANGSLHRPDLAQAVIGQGHADLVALGRAALANPDWPARMRLGIEFDAFDRAMIEPNASLENSDRWRAGAPGVWG